MKNNNNKPNNYLRYSGFGFQILTTLLLAVWAGQWLDKHYQSKINLFTIILSMLAIGVNLYQLYKMMNK